MECQKVVGFTYEDEDFEDAFRLDLLVDGDAVVFENLINNNSES